MEKRIAAEKARTGLRYAINSMPERDGKDQGEDSPEQAGSCWFARRSGLATSSANLYPPGVLFAYVVSAFSGVTFLKKNLNASRPSEHPPVRGEIVETFRWDHGLPIQKLFMAFKRVPLLW